MPAETHQRRAAVSVSEICDLLVSVLGLGDPCGQADDVRLAEVGCDEDLVLFDLWDAAVEEFGERTIGEPDLDDLRDVTTLGELACLIAGRCGAAGDNGGSSERGDQP